MKKHVTDFLNDESGQGMTEYALIIVVIAVALIGVLSQIVEPVRALFTSVENEVRNASK